MPLRWWFHFSAAPRSNTGNSKQFFPQRGSNLKECNLELECKVELLQPFHKSTRWQWENKQFVAILKVIFLRFLVNAGPQTHTLLQVTWPFYLFKNMQAKDRYLVQSDKDQMLSGLMIPHIFCLSCALSNPVNHTPSSCICITQILDSKWG